MLWTIEARIGQDNQKCEAGANMLIPVDFVLRVLTSLIELNRLDEVRHCLLEALAHRQSQAMRVQEIHERHEELTVINFVLHAKKYES